MLAKCLFRITSNSKRNISFFQKPVTLIPKNWVVVSQAFLSSANENSCTNPVNRSVYYREYLLSKPEYTNLFVYDNTKSNSKTAAILSQLNQEREDNLHLKDELSNYFNKELSQLSFDELCEATFLIMQHVYQNKNYPFWEDILEKINKECFNRVLTWTIDEKIKMTDVTTMFPIKFSCKHKLLFKLLYALITSTKHERILLHYFLMKKITPIPKDIKFDWKKRVEEIIPDTNSIEAGIICEGCLRSLKSLQDVDVLLKILMKAEEESETIHEIPFSSICRFAKKYATRMNFGGMPEFQNKMTNTALKFGTSAVILLAETGVLCGYLDSNLRNVLMKEVKDHFSELLLPSIERVVYLNTVFGIRDEEFLKMAVNAFESADVEESKRSLLLFLTDLIHLRIYPKSLFDRVLKQEFVDNLLDQNLKSIHAWWFIYCSLQLERPDWIGIDLKPKTRAKLFAKSKSVFERSFPKHHSLLGKLKGQLQQLFGIETTYYLKPLPQYQLGFLVVFDKNLKPQELPEEFEQYKPSFIIKPLKDDHIWMFFFIGYTPCFADESELKLNMILQTKLRQLSAIGYVPVFISDQIIWRKQIGPEYLNNLISAKMEEFLKDQKDAVSN